MKQELSLLQRFNAPMPKTVKRLFVGCALIVLNLMYVKWLMYYNDEVPSEWMHMAFTIGYLLAGVALGSCFAVDEDALAKKNVLNNIKTRVKNRTV